MPKYPVIASAVGALAIFIVSAGEAQANARICRQLEQEARELRHSGPSRASLERKLNRVERQVRSAGCSGFRLLFGGHAKRQCRALRANMHSLRRQVGSANFGRSPQRRLRSVETQMRRHGCSGNTRNTSVSSGGYRTMCVRTCDGYYFPIGFATAKDKLKRDQAACKSFYPAGAAELYVAPSGSDDETAMASLEGEAYAEQPFAFAYRAAYQPACANMLHAGARAGADETPATVKIDASAIFPIPVPRPSLSESEAIVVASSNGIAGSDAGKQADPDEIRVVGPATPYLTGKPEPGSPAAVAANSAPKRISPVDRAPTFFDQISSLFAPAAQAGESEK